MKLSFEFSRSKAGQAKKAVVATSTCAPVGRHIGIPADAGDGFAYNAEGRLLGRRVGQRAVDPAARRRRWRACGSCRRPSRRCRSASIGGSVMVSRKATPDHPLYEILHNQPNADMSAVDFWQVMLAALLLRGNAVRRATASATGSSAQPLLPDRGCRGSGCRTASSNTRTRTARTAALMRRRSGTSRPSRWTASSAFRRSASAPASSAARRRRIEASRNVFENGMAASGFVSYGKDSNAWLKEGQRDQLRDNIAKFTHSGAKPRRRVRARGRDGIHAAGDESRRRADAGDAQLQRRGNLPLVRRPADPDRAWRQDVELGDRSGAAEPVVPDVSPAAVAVEDRAVDPQEPAVAGRQGPLFRGIQRRRPASRGHRRARCLLFDDGQQRHEDARRMPRARKRSAHGGQRGCPDGAVRAHPARQARRKTASRAGSPGVPAEDPTNVP
jgi:hypothetical protein